MYLTKKLHQGTVASANNVTNWVGTIWITPIIGAYIADAHLGRYWTFIIASVIYISVCSLCFSSCISISLHFIFVMVNK
jgi:dipeptide/tripeptide permease